MVEIIFESHGTTLDNEKGLASGLYDVELSELGKKQAKELGQRHRAQTYDAIFCSDLKRSYQTAEIAFADRNFKIIKDQRLRECDYGNLEHQSNKEVNRVRINYVHTPFPGGESYQQCVARMKSFLEMVANNYEGKKVMIIGHRGTQYGLEHLINGVELAEAVTAPWQWQPGWQYQLKK